MKNCFSLLVSDLSWPAGLKQLMVIYRLALLFVVSVTGVVVVTESPRQEAAEQCTCDSSTTNQTFSFQVVFL